MRKEYFSLIDFNNRVKAPKQNKRFLNLKKLSIKMFCRFFLIVLIVAYFICAPIVLFPILKVKQNTINQTLKVEYMGILDLWNIDTFEGGSVSRSAWLEKRCVEFEKEHKGVFISVNNITVEQAILNIENGKKPDLLSVGVGIGDSIKKIVTGYTGKVNVRDDLLIGGKLEGEICAIPYLLGGYAIINYENAKKVVFGMGVRGNNNVGASLLVNENINSNVDNINNLYKENKNIDSYEAYSSYIKNNCNYLVGTQRDVYRITNRMANGKISSQNFSFLGGFSDLVQYMCVCAKDIVQKQICNNFIEYITSDIVQSTVSNINMFSVINKKLYSSSAFCDMENVLNSPLKTINLFCDRNLVLKQNLDVYEYISKENNISLSQLKKMYA